MHTLIPALKNTLAALLALAVSACAQSTPIKNGLFQGTLSGTPSGGVLNLSNVTLTLPGGGGGSGSVTSVAQTFTGGLVSVGGSPITGAGTLALTVAGTSGGIPYFSSGSTWASSAALTSNSIVLGGGAGAAPKVSTGITTNGTAQLVLGVNATTLGSLKFFGNTSGDVTIQPNAVAGTAVTVTLPATSTKVPIAAQQLTFTGPTAARTITLPDANITVARVDASQTFIGNQSFQNGATAGTTGTAGVLTIMTGAGVGKYTDIDSQATASRLISLPDADGVIALVNNTAALTNKTYNGLTITATTGTLTLGTFTVSAAGNTHIPIAAQDLTFTGPTAARTITLPDVNFTVARTSGANTFTGAQTFTAAIEATNGINAGDSATVGVATLYSGLGVDQYTVLSSESTSTHNVVFPDVSGNVVIDTATQTLTNKTLGAGSAISGAVVSSATMTLGSDATGDLYYRNSLGAITRLGIGTNGKILAVSSGLPAWVTASGTGDALTTNPLSQFAATTSSQLAGVISDETGTGALVFASSPTLVTPNLGTPSAATLTNATGLPISTGVSGLASGVATALATPSSANLRAAVTDESGTGALIFAGGNIGAATATTINGVTISSGSGTLTLANGSTLATSGANSLTFTTTGTTSVTMPLSGTLVSQLYKTNSVTIGNTASETSIFSTSIAGNTLGTTGTIRFRIVGNLLQNTGAGRTFNLKVKLGTTTIYLGTSASLTSAADRRPIAIEGTIQNLGSASSQAFAGTILVGSGTAPTTGLGSVASTIPLSGVIAGTSAEDTTSAKTLDVLWTHSVASASMELVAYSASVEVF